MIGITRRRVAWIAGAALLIVGSVYAVRLASLLAAYKAKMLCSEVWLAHRDPQTVITELDVDDLPPLRFVSASVDRPERAATASVAGVISQQAVFEDGRGCALEYGLPHTARDRAPVQKHASPSSMLPSATNPALDSVLDRAFADREPNQPRHTRAVVVIHDGRIVAERYAAGFGVDTPILGWSMTKTVMNAVVGVLVRQGRVAVNRPAPVPEWQGADDPRRTITLDDLLRMSSGLRFNESSSNPLSDATISLLRSPETAMYAVRQPLDDPPGTVWQYSSGTTNIISRAMRAVIADDARYEAFPHDALFARLGMSSAVIEADATGTFIGSSFMYATARDWARLGLLFVNDGMWDGQRILPEGWVAYTRTPAPADPQKRYGAHVWLKVAEQYSGDAVLPADAFHATGHAGQFVTMIPSERLVVVRLGLTRHPKVWDQTGFVRDVISVLGRREVHEHREGHEADIAMPITERQGAKHGA